MEGTKSTGFAECHEKRESEAFSHQGTLVLVQWWAQFFCLILTKLCDATWFPRSLISPTPPHPMRKWDETPGMRCWIKTLSVLQGGRCGLNGTEQAAGKHSTVLPFMKVRIQVQTFNQWHNDGQWHNDVIHNELIEHPSLSHLSMLFRN